MKTTVSLREGSEATDKAISYYHTDHLGSSSVITDADGNKVSSYEYQPYGTTAKTTGTDATNYKFTGKELDSTGLYYYGARYYDPEIGRFITADTLVQAPYDPQTLNRYTYCRNNPIKYIDPTGHSWKSFWNRYGGYFGLTGSFINACNTGDWNQFWRAALVTVIAIAANILLPGAGMLVANPFINVGLHIARGAAIGAVTGGISSEIMGGSFSDGARSGAITGGIQGFVQGVMTANWEQAGNGSNRNQEFDKFSKEMRERHALNVNQKDTTVKVVQRPLGKNAVGDPSSPNFGPRHRAIISDKLPNGKWEMGYVYKGGPIETTNTVDNLAIWGTHMCTEKSLSLGGDYATPFNVQVNGAALQENIALYESTFSGNFSYVATDHNSNFAVNSVIYGAGGDVPEGGWSPGFPNKP